MKNDIIKYIRTYIIHFKDGNKIEISNEGYRKIKSIINKDNFIEINGELYNRFEILKISKRDTEFDIYKKAKKYGFKLNEDNLLYKIDKAEREERYNKYKFNS